MSGGGSCSRWGGVVSGAEAAAAQHRRGEWGGSCSRWGGVVSGGGSCSRWGGVVSGAVAAAGGEAW